MALDDYLPFDPDGRETDTADDLDDIFDGLGLANWRDVMTDVLDPSIDISNIRGVRYNTPEEALYDIANRGIVWFMSIVYFPDVDQYGLYEDYPT